MANTLELKHQYDRTTQSCPLGRTDRAIVNYPSVTTLINIYDEKKMIPRGEAKRALNLLDHGDELIGTLITTVNLFKDATEDAFELREHLAQANRAMKKLNTILHEREAESENTENAKKSLPTENNTNSCKVGSIEKVELPSSND